MLLLTLRRPERAGHRIARQRQRRLGLQPIERPVVGCGRPGVGHPAAVHAEQRPVQSSFRVSLCAARTLNATGQCRVTLSLRQEHLRAGCGPRQEESGPEIRPKSSSQAACCWLWRCWLAAGTAMGARPAPSPSLFFVPGLPHVMLIELRQALSFVPG